MTESSLSPAFTAQSPILTAHSALDHAQLFALVNAYAHHVDARDVRSLGDLFVADGALFLPAPPDVLTPSREVRGRESIRAELAQLEAFEVTSHGILGHHVTSLDGDTATAVTRCEAHHVSRSKRDDSLRDLVWILRYADEYTRTLEGWKFSTRSITIDVVDVRTIRSVTPRTSSL